MPYGLSALGFFLLFIPLSLDAQPNTYFPHHLGDKWEYFVLDGIGNDTLQVRVVFDSTDPGGSSHFQQYRQFLNPIEPPEFPWYERFEADTIGNTYAIIPPNGRRLLYKFNAQVRQMWVIGHYSAGYDIARCEGVRADTLFGVPTTVIRIIYYGTQDTSDTTVWLTQYAEEVAEGFGTISRGGGDLGYNLFLRGCVINGIAYGDTTVVAVSESDRNGLPKEFELYQNFPNPFNPTTMIAFSIPQRSFVTIKVFDMLGREVATIVKEELGSGRYERKLDGSGLSSGIYLYRLQAGSFTETKKLLLLK